MILRLRYKDQPAKAVREMIAILFENYERDINTYCEQNSQFFYVKSGGTYDNHLALTG
jgi:hypothetical protein